MRLPSPFTNHRHARWIASTRYWFWHDQTAGGQGGNRNKPKRKNRITLR